MADTISVTIEEQRIEVTVLTPNFIQVNLLEPQLLPAVSENTSHRLGDGSDHADVDLNNSHRLGDGADHSDVSFNSAFVDPEGYNNNPLKAVLDLADIISIETSTGGVFSKVKATLQILKDLIGGGGGGGEWTEISRTTIAASVTTVEFVDKLTDDYDVYELEFYGLGVFTGLTTADIQLGVTPGAPVYRTIGYANHLMKPHSGTTSYSGRNSTAGFNFALPSTDHVINGKQRIYQARSASLDTMSNGSNISGSGAGLTYNNRASGEYTTPEKADHLRLIFSSAISNGLIVLRGKKA